MKKITATALKKILAQHALWLESARKQGKQANLQGANLYRANLQGANLYRANLKNANLYRANLAKANLTEANLFGTNLENIDFSGAILPKKELAVGKLYNLWSYKYVYPHLEVGTETLVCLLSIDEQNQTLEYIEVVSGEMRSSQPNWHKYSFIEAKE